MSFLSSEEERSRLLDTERFGKLSLINLVNARVLTVMRTRRIMKGRNVEETIAEVWSKVKLWMRRWRWLLPKPLSSSPRRGHLPRAATALNWRVLLPRILGKFLVDR